MRWGIGSLFFTNLDLNSLDSCIAVVESLHYMNGDAFQLCQLQTDDKLCQLIDMMKTGCGDFADELLHNPFAVSYVARISCNIKAVDAVSSCSVYSTSQQHWTVLMVLSCWRISIPLSFCPVVY